MWKTCFFLLPLLAIIIDLGSGADDGDLVNGLPGLPAVSFDQYAGYVNVGSGPEKLSLFYWFFEAAHPDSRSLPVALWIQGGPCSSIGYGAFSEIGPFLLINGTLRSNEYSWNKEANLIFLDSPVGTGFSYTDNVDYEYTDKNIAMDTYRFLVGWLQKFPDYRDNDLLLLGESYAGHYAPQLAAEILHQNEMGAGIHLNLKGFIIGNPWTDAYIDNKGTLEWYLSHSLISEETFEVAVNNCNLSISYYLGDVGNDLCKQAVNQLAADTREINIDNIYEDTCTEKSLSTSSKSEIGFLPRLKRVSPTWFRGVSPCQDAEISQYFNSLEVQIAAHVQRIPVSWAGCSEIYNQYSHKDVVASMLPIYNELLKSELKIWVYSGDWDGNVPTTSTQQWIRTLNLPTITEWHPWDSLSQVGGWTQVYKGLTFTTVRGAGHMVPSDRPRKALQILRSFLAGEPLPTFNITSV